MGEVLIDCATCTARDIACEECVVSVLLGTPALPATGQPYAAVLDEQERAAIGVLADAGLVPPLRLTPSPDGDPDGSARHAM